jgi:ribosomal protein S18 acetylase RimI-like enzyme
MHKQIKVIRFYPADWDKYRDDLMALENASFDDPELCMTEEEKKECMVDDPDVYAYIALDGERVIGETYGNILQKTDKDEFFEGHWDPATYQHFDKKTLYITSTATLPEYRGKGIAKLLKYEMFKDLKQDGFEYAIGHSNDGIMTAINEWFNGTNIGKFEHWYGSEETHNLMEMDLFKLPVLFLVSHLTALKDYDCGIASMAVLFDADEVPNHGEEEAFIGLTPKLGISHEDLLSYALKYYGFRPFSKYNCTIEDLVQRVDLHKLVIVNYQSGGVGHYSVVFGYDSECIYIMDVEDGKEKKHDKKAFDKCWFSNVYGSHWVCYF